MSSISLKKLLKKQEVRALLQEMVQALNIEINIEETSGQNLIGIGVPTLSNRYPITMAESTIGWVIGEAQAIFVANLLSFIAKQESEKRELAKELLERYQEIDLFDDISTQLTTSLETQQIAQLVLQEIHQLIESSAGAIILLKPGPAGATQPTLETIAKVGHLFDHWQPSFDQGIISNVLRSGRGELVNDIEAEARSPRESTIKALICVPLKAKEQVLGAIAIAAPNPDTYTTEHLKLVNIFASQTAVAIEKALLYEQSCQVATQAKAQADCLQQALEDLQLAQTQLIQSEKMSSLGQLIAGVAHEINNPINFICGNVKYVAEYAADLMQIVQSYQKSFPDISPELQSEIEVIDLEFLMQDMPKLLNSMKLGTDRIVEIVQSLKNFSRLDEAEMKAVNIHEGIDVTLMILRHRLKETSDRSAIQVIKEYGELPLVECYPGQLNQVFMNILANAIDAIEENIEKNSSQPPSIQIHTQVLDNEWVVIQIADNGSGMPEEIIQRIYDPFFTTKEIGKGTGLGMSISYQLIVDKHQGSLKCRSQPGKGTEFWIQIPIKCQATNPSRPSPMITSSHPVTSPQPPPVHLSTSIDRDGFVSSSPSAQVTDLLLRHIQLIHRLAQQYPKVEDLAPTNIYQIFQHNPISLKLYTTLLSQLSGSHPNVPLN